MIRKSTFQVTALAVALCVTPLTPAYAGKKEEREAIAFCESQRASFEQIRQRNREQTRGKTLGGALLGGLGGMLAGSQVKNSDGSSSTTATIIGAIAGAAGGGVLGYLDAKRKITQDNRELARLIANDASGRASRLQSMVDSIRSTGKCRQDQIQTWSLRLNSTRSEFDRREADRASRLAAAVDKSDRRKVERANKKEARADKKVLRQMEFERDLIHTAIMDDKKLQDDVLKYFDSDITTMAQAQAEVEGTSTASLLGAADGYNVTVKPPAILATNVGAIGGSTESAFGTASSAFGPSEPVTPPTPTKVATTTPGIEPWEAQIIRPEGAIEAENPHQTANIAQKEAEAEAKAATQTALARLQYVYSGA